MAVGGSVQSRQTRSNWQSSQLSCESTLQPCVFVRTAHPESQCQNSSSAKTNPAKAIHEAASCLRAFRWFLLVELIRAILAILGASLTRPCMFQDPPRSPFRSLKRARL
ncbi:unnamed protein product [Durusdinium trenchii]|uniref:Uncharacterized protein n=1 Tax=Durusdinium trenchii TaxID=1381693 RepID=A0ABP0IHX5_9DINO